MNNFPLASICIGGETNLSISELSASNSAFNAAHPSPDAMEVEAKEDGEMVDDAEEAEDDDKIDSRASTATASKYPLFIQITFKDESSPSSSANSTAGDLKIYIYHYVSINRLSLATSTGGDNSLESLVMSYLFHEIPMSECPFTSLPPSSLD